MPPPPDLAPRKHGAEMAATPTERYDMIAAIQKDDPSLEPPQLVEDYKAGPRLLQGAVVG